MGKVKIGTFNVENLFARYRFKSQVDPERAVRNGWDADKRRFSIYDEESKAITAKAIKQARVDVLALQEVENLDTLKRFRNQYLGGKRAYPYVIAVDGNDPRLIDLGILSKLPIVHIRSYQHLWVSSWRAYLFSRDCLEVDIQLPDNTPLTLYINHLKSMYHLPDPCNGRRRTRFKRVRQAQEVKRIVTERFGESAGQHPFIVLGDLNDYLDDDEQGTTGIDELVGWDQVENVVDRLPVEERWTHFFKGNRSCDNPPAYKQLDYVLLSKSLADSTDSVPKIIRSGLPLRAERYTGPRIEQVGQNKPKASDHCPVVMEVSF
jgi:endonuclease/exonuclease/phosphatase family metal-dependent hydrolase